MAQYDVGPDGAIVTHKEKQNGTLPEPAAISAHSKVIPSRGGNMAERHAFYEQHRDEILADFNSLDRLQFLEKWKVSSSTWSGLKRRWINGETKHREFRPLLPLWNEDWAGDIKVAWLNAYSNVYGKRPVDILDTSKTKA